MGVNAVPMFVISYDLRKQRNYQPLWDQLNAWNCQRVLESVWFGDLRGPAQTIRDILLTKMDGDDGLVVLELEPEFDWASARGQRSGTAWLQARSP